MRIKGSGWLCLFALCWILTGKNARAESISGVTQIQLNGVQMATEDASICLGIKELEEEQILLTFMGQGERNLMLYEYVEDDVCEEREPAFQESTDEEDIWIAEYAFLAEKNSYSFAIAYGEDFQEVIKLPVIFIDRTAPEAEGLHVFAKEQELSSVKGIYYYNSNVRVEIPVVDKPGGIRTASIWRRKITEEENTPEGLRCYSFEENKQHMILETEISDLGVWEIGILTEDVFGNVSEEMKWLGTIVIENEKPLLHMEVTGPMGENGFYTGDAKLAWKAEDALSEICEAELLTEGQLLKEWKLQEGEAVVGGDITLSAETYEGEIPVTFRAKDLAGNVERYETIIRMDAKAPVMELEWKAGQAVNGFYYAKARTATLRIWEKNFEENRIEIYNGEKKVSGYTFVKMPDEDCFMAELDFTEDGVYELHVDGKDLAGNRAMGLKEDTFIIDTMRPQIRVRYEAEEKGKHAFSKKRKALVTIKEDNPDVSNLELKIFLDEKEELLPSVSEQFLVTKSGWNGTILFEKEGEYRWSLQAADLAGNTSVLWESEPFLLDFTAPVLTLKGAEDGISINQEVELSVEGQDRWLREDSLKVLIYRDGTCLDLDVYGWKEEDKQSISFETFPTEAGWDGHYVVKAVCEDIVGNSAEQEWMFTVNRFGSSLRIDTALENILKKYYVNEIPSVILTERNADALQEQLLFLQDEEGLRLLNRGKEYSVVHSEDAFGWHQYTYEIKPEAFRTDGSCELSIHSRDVAGNLLDSRTVMNLNFFLDRQGPKIRIHENIVYISGNSPVRKAVFLLDEEQTASYSEEEILEAEGIFRLYPQNRKQTGFLRIEAWDAAGNHTCTEPLLLGDDLKKGEIVKQSETADSEEISESLQSESEENKKTSEIHKILIWILVVCIILCSLIVHYIKKQKENQEKSC